MKHFTKQFKWLVMSLMLCICSSAWGQTTYSLTPDQTNTGSNSNSYITTLTEFTYNGISWKMNQWNPKTLQVKTNQGSAANEFRFYNTSAFSGRITQVVITFSALTVSDASKLMFLGGTSEITETTGGTAGTWDGTTKTLTWTPGASDNFTYFAFYQNGQAASGTNYLASSNAIVVTYETGPVDNRTATTVEIDYSGLSNNDIYSSTKAGTLTATVKAGETSVSGASVTWESSDENVATIGENTGVVTLVGVGTVTFTANYDGDDEYKASSDTYELEVVNSDPNLPGRVGNPYTVVQAKAAIDAGTGTTGVYAKGIISKVDSYNNSSHAITYWISDDGTITNQLQIYGGLKSKNNENGSFSAKGDLQVGDYVTVFGNLKKYNSTYEFDSNNYLTSFKRKSDSDLTITSDNPVALEKTYATPFPTSTITWTTSSTGVMSFESDDESVATVTDAGVITAVGAGEATITIKQATDDDYKDGEKTVTVNVTDNRSVCATGISLTSSTTLTVGDMDDFSATSTKNADFTGSITYTYETSDATILEEATGTYSANKVGNVTVTITATPTGGNADSFKPASQEVVVTVNGTNSISLDPTSKTVAFSSSTFDITATVPTDNYNGAVSAESSNEAVATVSVDGTTVTVTPKAVGSATITVTAGTDTYYPSTAQEVCTIEFTQPVGGTEAKTATPILLFGESFGNNTGSARTWDDSYSDKSGVNEVYSGITSYTVSNVKQGKNTTGSNNSGLNQSSQGTDAYIIFGPLNVADYKNLELTYQWKAASIKETYTTSAYYATSSTGDYSEVTGTGTGATSFVERSYSLPEAAQVSTLYLKIVWNTSNTQAIIDEVQLSGSTPSTESVTLNNSGYATYCSEYPLDFSEATDYSAWYVTGVSGENISFAKITGGIKGGEGILLKGTPNATISITSKASDTSLGNDNWFVGTLAPTYIENVGEAYGLSGNTFVKNNAPGAIKANRAYIPASKLPSEVKSLNFIFDDISTGINSIETMPMDGRIFNLQGQEVKNPVRGIYIVNGKKVLIK